MPSTNGLQQHQQQQAVPAARKLQELMRGPRLPQLLQHPPPASPTAQQRQVMVTCMLAVQRLDQALLAARGAAAAAAAGQLLGSLLRLDAVHNTAALVAWALQRQEQLQRVGMQAVITDPLTAIWAFALPAVMTQIGLVVELSSSSAAQLAIDATQQLERSGEKDEDGKMILCRTVVWCMLRLIQSVGLNLVGLVICRKLLHCAASTCRVSGSACAAPSAAGWQLVTFAFPMP